MNGEGVTCTLAEQYIDSTGQNRIFIALDEQSQYRTELFAGLRARRACLRFVGEQNSCFLRNTYTCKLRNLKGCSADNLGIHGTVCAQKNLGNLCCFLGG